MKVYLTCPVQGHLVQIEFRHDRGGRIDGVNSCSVFCPETAVACGQLCARLLNEKIDRQQQSAESDG